MKLSMKIKYPKVFRSQWLEIYLETLINYWNEASIKNISKEQKYLFYKIWLLNKESEIKKRVCEKPWKYANSRVSIRQNLILDKNYERLMILSRNYINLIYFKYLSVASNIVKFWRPHCANRCAAESPAIPAPMMTTVGSGLHGSSIQGSNWHVSNLASFGHGGISFSFPPLLDAKFLHIHG